MVQISNYLLNLDLKELLEILEKDDDIDNIMIILQMLEINDFAALERLKMEAKAEEEDDLLAAEDDNKKEDEKEKLQQAKNKCDKTHAVIQSILAQPLEFWKTNDPSAFANSLLGTIIIPGTKEERSATAGGILFGIVKSKDKTFNGEYDGTRKGLINVLKTFKKEKSAGKDIII